VRNILIAAEPGVHLTRRVDTINPALNVYVETIKASTALDRLAVAAFHQAQSRGEPTAQENRGEDRLGSSAPRFTLERDRG
jgi:hypothetical protein